MTAANFDTTGAVSLLNQVSLSQISEFRTRLASIMEDVKPAQDSSGGSQSNGSTTETLTQLAARRLEEIRHHDLPKNVQEKAITCLLDYLGALVSGLSTPWSSALLKYAKGTCATAGEARVMGLDTLVSAEMAAFTNAAIAHRRVILHNPRSCA